MGERLWVYAHANEAPSFDLGRMLCAGTGKAASAVAVTKEIVANEPDLVIAFGLAGVYPSGGLSVGDICLVREDRLADEGALTPTGFSDLDKLRIGHTGPWFADAEATTDIAGRLNSPIVAAATVSTCSATDELSEMVSTRSLAAIETMEGAAIAYACHVFGVPWVQIRAISNRTGDRDKAGWDIEAAITNLHRALLKV